MPGIFSRIGQGAWNASKSVYKSPGLRKAGRGVQGAARQYGSSAMHGRGMRFVKEGYGFGKGMSMFGRAVGFGFLGLEAYMGYQREGVWGAAKGAATGAAYSYAFGAVLGAAAGPVALGALAVGGGMYANKMMAEKGASYMKGQSKLEFGSSVSDQFGTVSTMRRRSVMALNSSRIGGGMGMGNEAMRQYQPYFR